MRLLISAFCLTFSLLWANSVAAQSISQRINYGPCTITDIEKDRDAYYAAAVGIMSTDRNVRLRILDGIPGRKNAQLCTFQVSDSFCKSDFLQFTMDALTTSMTLRPSELAHAGAYLFAALGFGEAVEDPAGNAIALTLGVGGGIIGGISGSNDGLGGTLKGALKGGSLGLGGGAALGHHIDLARCERTRSEFSALTDKMMADGFRPQRIHNQLFGEILRLSARYSAEEQEVAKAMIEAMAVTVKKIHSVRHPS